MLAAELAHPLDDPTLALKTPEDADRAVLLRALPTILDGIDARGWRAVRVDTLLNEPGYLDRC